jgi:hypothetical protein
MVSDDACIGRLTYFYVRQSGLTPAFKKDYHALVGSELLAMVKNYPPIQVIRLALRKASIR